MADRLPVREPSAEAGDSNLNPVGPTPLPAPILHVKTTAARAAATAETLRLPGPCGSLDHGNFEALWIGPGEWLLLGRAGASEWAGPVADEIRAIGGAASPASDSLTVLGLDLPADLVARLTGLPTDTFVGGRVARTRVADAIVAITGSATLVRFVVATALAPHLRAWLERAL